jgi:hypothetical protein
VAARRSVATYAFISLRSTAPIAIDPKFAVAIAARCTRELAQVPAAVSSGLVSGPRTDSSQEIIDAR